MDFSDELKKKLGENVDFRELEMKRKEDLIRAQAERIRMREGLPHLFGWLWYSWAREFFDSVNRINLLCAANQISKSSTQIRKAIHWATCPELWASLWTHQPTQFWYLYPTSKQVRIEFQTKWKQFLPKGEFKDHPIYGWKDIWINKELFGIEFNSGVTIFFKTYAQDTQALQTGTVDALFCFPAGTGIATAIGPRPIEHLQVGDWVRTHKGIRKIVRVQQKQAQVITRSIGGREITATPDHPFWTYNRGWVQFGALTIGDDCVRLPEYAPRSSTGTEEPLETIEVIVKNSVRERILFKCPLLMEGEVIHAHETTVYNIEVEDSHTYFAEGFLVHNCDEELPMDHYEELMFRLTASDGYFHMVFTATLGQDYWRQVMEPLEHEPELLPQASKWTVSLYDARFYEDGTPSHWTDEKIQRVVDKCSSPAEILKRVWGRFIKADGGRKYEQFDLKRHMMAPVEIPHDWAIYVGVDVGSGGVNHPGAIAFVAVSPDHTQGRVIKCWRGDKGTQTTASDIMDKFQQMRKELGRPIYGQYYDAAGVDFGTIAGRIGEPFQRANKKHDVGESIINSLFKTNRLFIFGDDYGRQLAGELSSLRKDTPKTKAKDDLADAMRYAVTSVMWDFSDLAVKEVKPDKVELTQLEREIEERRALMKTESELLEQFPTVEQEMEEWNEMYE